jgi:hypothetical protein
LRSRDGPIKNRAAANRSTFSCFILQFLLVRTPKALRAIRPR